MLQEPRSPGLRHKQGKPHSETWQQPLQGHAPPLREQQPSLAHSGTVPSLLRTALGQPGQQEAGRVWGGYGKNFPILREELSPKKNSQHLRSRALGILSRGAGSKANQQTNRDRVRKSWGVCSSGTRDLWLIRNKLPRRQGGKEAFSGHVSSPFPALWELNQIREREIFSQKLRPVTQARGRERVWGRGERTSSFPSKSRIMSQHKD